MEFRKKVMMTLHAGQKKRHRYKEQTLDSVGDGEGEMIWENSTETCILPYVKQMTNARCMKQSTQSQCFGPTQRDMVGREMRGGFSTGGNIYTFGWFMSTYGKNHHNIVN